MFWPKKSTAPLKPGARGPSRSLGPQIQHHEVLDHQRQAEGREQLEQLRRMIDPPQQHHLDDHADHRDDQRRGDDAAPEAERAGEALGQREGDIGAEHVEGAVGEIDDPRHAEDDRQARRDQKQRRRAGKAGQELDDSRRPSAVRVCESPRPALAGRGRIASTAIRVRRLSLQHRLAFCVESSPCTPTSPRKNGERERKKDHSFGRSFSTSASLGR